jgi:hypothetical protein
MKKFHFWHDFIPLSIGFNIQYILDQEVSGIFCVTGRVDLVLLLAADAWDNATTEQSKTRDFSNQDG